MSFALVINASGLANPNVSSGNLISYHFIRSFLSTFAKTSSRTAIRPDDTVIHPYPGRITGWPGLITLTGNICRACALYLAPSWHGAATVRCGRRKRGGGPRRRVARPLFLKSKRLMSRCPQRVYLDMCPDRPGPPIPGAAIRRSALQRPRPRRATRCPTRRSSAAAWPRRGVGRRSLQGHGLCRHAGRRQAPVPPQDPARDDGGEGVEACAKTWQPVRREKLLRNRLAPSEGERAM